MYEYKPILTLFQGFEPLFASLDPDLHKMTSKIRIRINVMRIRSTGI
jgi:hypothetical protein